MFRSISNSSDSGSYYSFNQFNQKINEEKLQISIAEEEKKLDVLIHLIDNEIAQISDPEMRRLLGDTFNNSLENIPELQQFINRSLCEDGAKCACLCTAITAASACIGASFMAVVGLFKVGSVATPYIVGGATYGSMTGGGAAAVLTPLAFLRDFYELAKLAHLAKKPEIIAERIAKLQIQLQKIPVEPYSPPDPDTGLQTVKLN